MNTKQSYRGFKSTKWDNKSESQKAKALKNQFEKLGYKIPKYLDKGRITDKQLEKTLNRIDKAYQKRIEKEQPKIKLSDIQYEVNKYNRLVDKRLKYLENQGFSDKAIEYLKGGYVFLTIGDRAYFSNNSLLEKFDINGLKANQEGRRTTINLIKENYKKLSSIVFKDNILNSKQNRNRFNNFLNLEWADNLSEGQKHHVLELMSGLNIIQQEIFIQTYFQNLRVRYENSETLTYSHVEKVYGEMTDWFITIKQQI